MYDSIHSGSSSNCSSGVFRKSLERKLKNERLFGGGPTNIGTWFLCVISSYKYQKHNKNSLGNKICMGGEIVLGKHQVGKNRVGEKRGRFHYIYYINYKQLSIEKIRLKSFLSTFLALKGHYIHTRLSLISIQKCSVS